MRKMTVVGLSLVGIAIITFGLGFAVAKLTALKTSADNSNAASHYPLLAKRIFQDNPNDTLINFVPLRKTLQEKLRTLSAPYSFYFEYLPTGTAVRVGDDQELVAASLIKLPVVMDLYRAAELGKVDLDEEETLVAEDLNNQFGDLYKRGAGAKVTLRDAAKFALSQSDNTAILTIQKRTKGLLPADISALDAVDADYNAQADQVLINSKSYASVLKCLYFACYINRDDSQELLGYLAQSVFNAGIAHPIPENIQIAHKIGTQYNKLTQSDCGIIYVPKRQYLLCIMVGLPEQEATKFMSEISALVYQTVSQHD